MCVCGWRLCTFFVSLPLPKCTHHVKYFRKLSGIERCCLLAFEYSDSTTIIAWVLSLYLETLSSQILPDICEDLFHKLCKTSNLWFILPPVPDRGWNVSGSLSFRLKCTKKLGFKSTQCLSTINFGSDFNYENGYEMRLFCIYHADTRLQKVLFEVTCTSVEWQYGRFEMCRECACGMYRSFNL